LLRGVQCQTLNSCDFSSDGKFVASAGQGEGGKVNNQSDKFFNSICLPPLPLHVCASYLFYILFIQPFVYNMETNIYVTMSATVSNPILDVRFQPGSNIFATSSYANTVKLWNAETVRLFLFNSLFGISPSFVT
jgi:WD40 repeat protein